MTRFPKYKLVVDTLAEAQANGYQPTYVEDQQIVINAGPYESTLQERISEVAQLNEYYSLLNRPLLKAEASRLRLLAVRFGFTLDWETIPLYGADELFAISGLDNFDRYDWSPSTDKDDDLYYMDEWCNDD